MSRITRERHGASRGGRVTAEYQTWIGIIQRCEDPNMDIYPHYGGRGIVMCEKWRNSFAAFLNDVGEKPSPKHSIDRINNDGNYEPGNVRWVTQKEQCRNRRSNRFMTSGGLTLTLVEWTERLGVSRHVIYQRIKNGMSEEEALQVSRQDDQLARESFRSQVIAMRNAGMKQVDIAKALGVGCKTVFDVLKKAGMTKAMPRRPIIQ